MNLKKNFFFFYCRPKFRSYKPQDDSLKNSALEDAKAADIESEVQDQLHAAKTKPDIEELVSYLKTKYFADGIL